ncbi:hypothetical protein P4S72_12660 [Vibrio sp. PP-XX7]
MDEASHERTKVVDKAPKSVEKPVASQPVVPEKKVNTQFFVNEHKLAVRNKPDINDYPIRYMYKGDKITVLEQKMAGEEFLDILYISKVVLKLLNGLQWMV